jgi:hypothetical protein
VHRFRDPSDALRRHIHPDLSGQYKMRELSELSMTVSNPVLCEILADDVTLTLSPRSSDLECLLWAIDVERGGKCVVATLHGASIPTSDHYFELSASGGVAGGRVQMQLSFKGVPYQPGDGPSQVAFRVFAWHGDSDVPACAVGVLNPLTQ